MCASDVSCSDVAGVVRCTLGGVYCSTTFFQHYREISLDERMVKSEIWQYIRDKVVKWGFKLLVLAGLKTSYAIQFTECRSAGL